MAERHGDCLAGDPFCETADAPYQGGLSELIIAGLHWLAPRQNPDGGWNDPECGASCVVATVISRIAVQLTGVPAKYPALEPGADAFLNGSLRGSELLRRLGGREDRAYPLVAASAAVGLARWSQVPRNWLGKQIYSPSPNHAPAVAAALARWRLSPHLSAIRSTLGRSIEPRMIQRLEKLQDADGSFHASTSDTALVVLLLAAAGLRRSRVANRGVDALLASAHADGSWPESPRIS